MWRKIKKNVNKTRGGLSERPAHSPAFVGARFGTERFSLCHGKAADTGTRTLEAPGSPCQAAEPAGSLLENVEVKVNMGKPDQMPFLPDRSFLLICGSSPPSHHRHPAPDAPPPEPAAPAPLDSAVCVFGE